MYKVEVSDQYFCPSRMTFFGLSRTQNHSVFFHPTCLNLSDHRGILCHFSAFFFPSVFVFFFSVQWIHKHKIRDKYTGDLWNETPQEARIKSKGPETKQIQLNIYLRQWRRPKIDTRNPLSIFPVNYLIPLLWSNRLKEINLTSWKSSTFGFYGTDTSSSDGSGS